MIQECTRAIAKHKAQNKKKNVKMEKIELKWRRRGRKNISCMWNTWRFIMSRIKRIKANGKLLHNGGGERVHKHTFFPSVCVYERVCMWVCASPKCELRAINIIFQYVQPLRIRVCVLSRAKVVVKQMCAFYVSFLLFFFFYFFFVSCFRFLPPFLSHSLSLSVRYELVCVCECVYPKLFVGMGSESCKRMWQI